MLSQKRGAPKTLDERPQKKQKALKSVAEEAQKKQKPATPKAAPKAAPASVLREEESAFPRGGASILTPLERRQIQNQAKQDVLFEQSTGKPAAAFDSEGEDGDMPMDGTEGLVAKGAKLKQNSRTKQPDRKSKAKAAPVVDKGPRIEGLSYKRLVAGSLALGQVSAISRHNIALALPNNITGYVSPTAISYMATKKVEKLAAEEAGSDEDEAEAGLEELRLQDYVRLGQYLRAYVVSVGSVDAKSSDTRNKRHVALSIAPERANSELSLEDLVVDSMVQASVESVEDHGVIMDLGVGDANIKGFVSSREIGHDRNIADLKPGAVELCLITGLSSNGKIVKLSMDHKKIGDLKKSNFLVSAPSVNAFMPGTAVEFLVSEVTETGILGKAMGLLDVTADLIHSNVLTGTKPLVKRHPVGSKAKGRIMCTFPTAEEKKVGLSLLSHVLDLTSKETKDKAQPISKLPISTIVEEAKISRVDPGIGAFFDLGANGPQGFAHISRLSDEKVLSIASDSGPYKKDTVHRARVVGFNPLDGLFIVSLEKSVLEARYLRLEDVTEGDVVSGTVKRLLTNTPNHTSVLVNLSENIVGLIPEMHLSDIVLQHPERKFKEDSKITVRVLGVDLDKRRIRLTAKRSLVNGEAPVWKSYDQPTVGAGATGTIVLIHKVGAVISFYGTVQGFLPISQMSDSYIKDPQQHFRVGQVLNVHVLSIDAEQRRMTVSCRDPSLFGPVEQEALNALNPGQIINATVTEKTNDDIVVELDGSGLKATLSIEHLTDGSSQKCLNAAKRIRVGQELKDLVVLSKNESKHLITLTDKPLLLKAAKQGGLLQSFDQVAIGAEVVGFVRQVTATAVFMQFAGALVGLLPKTELNEDAQKLPSFGLRRNASMTARVLSVDSDQERFLLTQREQVDKKASTKVTTSANDGDRILENPVDGVSTSINDFKLGALSKARVVSVKDTQLNVVLADGVQGRIDVSQVFDAWEDIKNRKHPLRSFNTKQILPVRILGLHDSRNHRFLPITHTGHAPVFELTAKPSDVGEAEPDILTVDKVKADQDYICFVNNIAEDHLWVNLSPNVRGRIRALDLTDDVSMLSDLATSFPIGSAIRARILTVDAMSNRIDLAARQGKKTAPTQMSDLSKGMVLPGRVTRIGDRQIMVQLSETVSGPVHLVDMADDFSKASTASFEKNQFIRVHVSAIDVANKRLTLSTRPSKVLSSSLAVADRDIKSVTDLKVNDVVRGFIKNVADNGVFIAVSSTITAFVRVSDLSDMFIKDWKAEFEVDRLVKGKVIVVDPTLNHLQLSLKESVLDKDYKAPLTYKDLKVGQIVTGKVRKVEDYGVFIVIDNSANVSGLCHRSEMADELVSNVKEMYDEGDVVKAKVLKIEVEKRRVALGLKTSYFDNEPDHSIRGNNDDSSQDGLEEGREGEDEMQGVLLPDGQADQSDEELVGDLDELSDSNKEAGVQVTERPTLSTQSTNGLGQEVDGLNVGRSAWSTDALDIDRESESDSVDDSGGEMPKKKKRKRAEIEVDRTGELDANGPQSSADFERLLLGDPNSAQLWIGYMAYYLQLNDVGQAREMAERAVKTVNHQHRDTEQRALDVWVAYLNLENTYGTDEALEEVFKRAVQFNDAEQVHNHLTSIYIQSGKSEKADALLQSMIKKFSQDPKIWLNCATFLFNTINAPVRGRELLPRALQALPKHAHVGLTIKFAQLEFKSENGDPERGRTIFEGLMDTFPKRLDISEILLSHEKQQGDKDQVRRLYGRMTATEGLKVPKATKIFKRWFDWEEKEGDAKSLEKVKAKAAAFVQKRQEEKEKAKSSSG